jgi:hypothetical protein
MIPFRLQSRIQTTHIMNTKTFLATLVTAALCQFAPDIRAAEDVDSLPPVVVKTFPESGKKDIPAGEIEIRITFSKEMTDGSWSLAGPIAGAAFIPVGKLGYEKDKKTCVWKVKLEPGKTYAYWVNNNKFQNFKDAQGNPSVPYLLVFQTKGN